jgi:hypothetical protein
LYGDGKTVREIDAAQYEVMARHFQKRYLLIASDGSGVYFSKGDNFVFMPKQQFRRFLEIEKEGAE